MIYFRELFVNVFPLTQFVVQLCSVETTSLLFYAEWGINPRGVMAM